MGPKLWVMWDTNLHGVWGLVWKCQYNITPAGGTVSRGRTYRASRRDTRAQAGAIPRRCAGALLPAGTRDTGHGVDSSAGMM